MKILKTIVLSIILLFLSGKREQEDFRFFGSGPGGFRRLGLFFIGKKIPVKKDEDQDADGDVRIRQIEYRPEKYDIIPAPERNPGR